MKYLCINDVKRSAEHFQNWVEVGQHYTLRDTRATLEAGTTGMLFEELRNKPIFFPALGGFAEPGFDSKRFVRIDDIESEMEFAEEKEEHASI